MVTTRKSSNTAAAASASTDNSSRSLRSDTKAAEVAQKEVSQETGGAAGVSKAQCKGAKAAKEKKKKAQSMKTSIQRLEEDQNANSPRNLTPAEKVLVEENISIAPPPRTMKNTGSIKQAQASFSGTKDTLNEEETLMPLESQADVGSVKQANISVTSENTRSIKKTSTSVSENKETFNEEESSMRSQMATESSKQTHVFASGSKDTLNEEETLLSLGSQGAVESMKQTNNSAEEEALQPLGSQLQDMALSSKKSEKYIEHTESSSEKENNNKSSESESSESEDGDNAVMDVVEKENVNKSSESESSESGHGADVAMDVDITPKKAKPVLKHGRAPSSPHAKSSDIRSASKVSRCSISHSSATSTLSEISSDYLQGASHIVGGFSRGHAAGNTYNYGDEEEDPFITAPDTKGDIRLFFKSDTTDPDFVIMDQQPSSDFHDVLETLGNIYSPVAKRNSRISIRENGYWSLKGKYLNISQKQKPISAHWKLSDQNKYFIEVLADGANIEQKSESTGLMVSKPSGSSSKLLDSSESPEDIAKAMIISHFNIPEHLFKKSSKEQDIRATYEKYEIIENIWNNHQPDLSAIGAVSKSKVDKKQIISLLIAPSTYYSYASNVFPLLHYYPEMMSWMKWEEDIDTNKVWKSKKADFVDLLSILEGKRDAIENESQRREVESEEDPESEEEVVKKNKGKGKQREDKGNKGKSKDDKEGKEKSKRSHRKDKGKSKQL
ncbi:hypothetical protein BDQ17DRAFT_1435230 [Cyathus striatus]|nr:hypothetical protein BDQ17DRAFT_1435230 [Cyathus striatus]